MGITKKALQMEVGDLKNQVGVLEMQIASLNSFGEDCNKIIRDLHEQLKCVKGDRELQSRIIGDLTLRLTKAEEVE